MQEVLKHDNKEACLARIHGYLSFNALSEDDKHQVMRDIDRILYSDGSYEDEEADRYRRIKNILMES